MHACQTARAATRATVAASSSGAAAALAAGWVARDVADDATTALLERAVTVWASDSGGRRRAVVGGVLSGAVHALDRAALGEVGDGAASRLAAPARREKGGRARRRCRWWQLQGMRYRQPSALALGAGHGSLAALVKGLRPGQRAAHLSRERMLRASGPARTTKPTTPVTAHTMGQLSCRMRMTEVATSMKSCICGGR